MAEIIGRASVSVAAEMRFSEPELRALDALASYGDKAFIEVFYKHLGETYLRPHEAGLRTFLQSIRQEVPRILRQTKLAREAFDGKPEVSNG